LPLPDTNHQTLVVHHAAPRSASAQALALLATTTAPDEEHEQTSNSLS
jgi:hypothetical protein